jgi:hypothetical protein
MAAVVKVARAGTTVDMGPPLGCETYDRDAIVVDYFFGTASRFRRRGNPGRGPGDRQL